MEQALNLQNWAMVAEIELSYKPKIKPSERPQINNSKDGYNVFLQSWDDNKIEFIEQFKIMLLNRRNKILGILEISRGTVDRCIVDPKQIFCAAIKANASSIMLCHNHPSGNLQPSENDKAITLKLREGARLLEFKVLDHLIITPDGYFSFADDGLL